MEKRKFTYWNDNSIWIGYLEDYPDYLTQGETFEELKEQLIDIYKTFASGTIPCVRKSAELEVA
jgi:hypothetical protein